MMFYCEHRVHCVVLVVRDRHQLYVLAMFKVLFIVVSQNTYLHSIHLQYEASSLGNKQPNQLH